MRKLKLYIANMSICSNIHNLIPQILTLKRPITTAADNKFCNIFLNFRKKVWYFIRIVCQQTILIKYHSLFGIFEKADFFNCRMLQIIGGALRVKYFTNFNCLLRVNKYKLDSLWWTHKVCLGAQKLNKPPGSESPWRKRDLSPTWNLEIKS